MRRLSPAVGRQCIALLSAMLLSACVAPTTDTPTISKAEWQREVELQEAAAKKAPINFDEKKEYNDAAVAHLAGRLKPIATRVSKAAGAMCHALDDNDAARNCTFEVLLDAKKTGLNAHADGQNVVIYPAMIDFTHNDSQLAFVIAHEFAHNIMAHVDSQRQNVTVGAVLGALADAAAGAAGANTGGAFSKAGSQTAMLRYSSSFEAEADYVGLYILARAGYAIEQAPDFWRMMSQAQPKAIYISQTHPNNPSRTIAMTKTVAEIRAKQRARKPLIPNIRPKDA